MSYNIACRLSDQGYKTLLIDADPQCNLTLLALGVYRYEELWLFAGGTIYHVVEQLLAGTGDVTMIAPTPIRSHLDILPGNLQFTDFDDLLTTSYSEINGTGARRGFMVVSALKRYMDEIAIQRGYDVIIIDVSPSMTGSLNKTIMLSTDFFLTICNPDLFSKQWVMNLGRKIKKRKTEQQSISMLAKRDGSIPAGYLVDGQTTFLGYVLNDYNVYSEQPIADHRARLETIQPDIKENLSELSRNWLVAVSYATPLGMTQDYGRISALGQQENKPLYEVTEKELSASGSIELLHKCTTQIGEMTLELVDRLVKWGV